MTLNAPAKASKPRELPPTGTHIARCIGLIHVGTYETTDANGNPDLKNEIRLTFELPNLPKVKKDDREYSQIISKSYRLSMGSKANLRKLVENMIGASLEDEEANGFDVESLVGLPCLITIVHKTSKKGSKYEDIASVTPMIAGQSCPPPIRNVKILTYEKWDPEFFDSLPDFLRELMSKTQEYQKIRPGIPF